MKRLEVAAICLGALCTMGFGKMCAKHVGAAHYYNGGAAWPVVFGTGFASVHDQTCADDLFGPTLQLPTAFAGVPEWLDGDSTTATKPATLFVADKGGTYHVARASFRATALGPGFDVYHFEGLVIVDQNACNTGARCDFMSFGPLHDAPANGSYEITSGWYDGTGARCQNHYYGVPFYSTFCNGGHAGCTDHQTQGFAPFTSSDAVNWCDWYPVECTVMGHAGANDCPAGTFQMVNDDCCTCNGKPAGEGVPF